MTLRSLVRLLPVLAMAAATVGGLGCPGKKTTWVAAPTAPTPGDVDADPVALLPYGAVALANLDAKTITNSSAGGDLAALAERMIPFAQQIDFQVKRDLDHAYFGWYSFSGADVLGVLTGSFHPDKLEDAVAKGINTPYGVVVASTYAGRKLYTVSNVGFTILSAKTALVGSEAAMRRALDRVQAGTLKRETANWMGEWVMQPGYQMTVASDVTKQSFPKTVVSYIPWIQGVQYIRARGRFNPDSSFGMSGALTYPDAAKAATAAQGLSNIPKSFMTMAVLKVIGIDPLFRSMTVTPAGNDVQFSTVIDEKQTRQVIGVLTGWLGSGMPAPSPPPASPTPAGSGGGTSI